MKKHKNKNVSKIKMGRVDTPKSQILKLSNFKIINVLNSLEETINAMG